MKFFKTVALFLTVAAFIFACESKPESTKIESETATQEAAEAEAEDITFMIDTSTSVINWIGGKKFINDNHNGTIKIASGNLAVKEGNITAGEFTIDMNSIVNLDLNSDKKKADLVGHLMSPDFFDTANHPAAKFAIVSAEPISGQAGVTHNITGNLTMRDSTKQITFPANVLVADGKITAVAPNFTIDRTEWNVAYGNEGLVALAKEKIIANDITLQIRLDGVAE